MRNYLGIDIGTSGCKAVVFDPNGRQLAVARREYNVIATSDGGAELDSEEVIAQCLRVIAEAGRDAGPGSVGALGISSQGEAFTAVGSDGAILNRAMVSSDMRAARIARQWPRRFGVERLYRITGHTAHPMFTLFKLLWLRQAKPSVWARAKQFLCFEDLLGLRLGIEPAISWSLAGRTMLFDVCRHCWDAGILAAVGLNPGQLARPLPSGTKAGEIAASIARDLHLAPNAFIVTGGHDQPCGALGAGAIMAGTAMYATGSVECIAPTLPRAVFSTSLRRHNLCTYDHVVPRKYTTVAFSLTGGNLLKWIQDEFGAAEVAAARRRGVSPYQRLLELVDPKPTRLMALPYFTPSGTPYFDLETKGAVLGLRLSSRRGEILRALLEGIAFEMRLNLDLLTRSGCVVDELRAIGGGARSALWTQLKADVLGKPITVLDVIEAGCLGAAMLACAADTGEPVVQLAARWVRPIGLCRPDPATARWYARRFPLYRRLQPALRALKI